MCIFSLSAVWTDDAVAEYAKVFGPIVEQSRRVLGKKQIESLKSNNSVLESISTIKKKLKKINAHVQKLKRQEKAKCR